MAPTAEIDSRLGGMRGHVAPYEFCTLFDVNYLARGLALYRSLAAVCDEFRLRVFCMDAETKRLLDDLDLPHLHAIALEHLEAHDPELLQVKPTRTAGEYCWTATPCVCLCALDNEPDLGMITYLDADLLFHSDPAPVFDELDGGSIMIVPHRPTTRFQPDVAWAGIYNVGMLTFRRDENGVAALRWWRRRCLEWCYKQSEDGKFGDQKYLDDWPVRFRGVHVLQNFAGGVAPWNSARYTFDRKDGQVTVDGEPLIFYHYQTFQLVHGRTALRRLGRLSSYYTIVEGNLPLTWTVDPWFCVDSRERRVHWDAYARDVAAAIVDLRRINGRFDGGITYVRPRTHAVEIYRGLKRRLTRAAPVTAP